MQNIMNYEVLTGYAREEAARAALSEVAYEERGRAEAWRFCGGWRPCVDGRYGKRRLWQCPSRSSPGGQKSAECDSPHSIRPGSFVSEGSQKVMVPSRGAGGACWARLGKTKAKTTTRSGTLDSFKHRKAESLTTRGRTMIDVACRTRRRALPCRSNHDR